MKILASYDLERHDIIQVAKAAAEPYLEKADASKAWISFATVMRQHNATKKDFNLSIGTMWVLRDGGNIPIDEMRKFIEGF